MKTSGRRLARRCAVQALYQWDMTGRPAAIKEDFIDNPALTGAYRDYFDLLLEAVPAKQAELDALLAPLLDRAIDKVDCLERAILRLALYELIHQPDMPPKVVLNEAIELAREFGAEHSYRYVNGVLDRWLKSADKVTK